ncbi:2'-5' RNA ligase family protein [Actinoplanes sp. NPDC051346]|uniref:2'-5' RNA ligase family protein n=1 Tax=Actinoplanes sp. NPDC051346 TaxID=3155048 RepID=UPI00343BE6DA
MARTSTTRIGVAIDIPQPWGHELTRRRAEAGDPQAAYTPAHVTLLGPTEVSTAALPAIEKHLDTVATGQEPFAIHLRGTGTFRPITEVVFVTLAVGISECELLAEAIAAAEGVHRDSRFPYHPHVTVAQDVSAEALDAVFDDLAEFEARFDVPAFTLFSHDLSAAGDGPWQRRRDYPLGVPRRSSPVL